MTGGRGTRFSEAACGDERFHELVLRGALVHDLELDAEFHGQHGGQVVVEAGVDGGHLAQGHELAEQLVGLDADHFGEVADGDRRFDGGAVLAGGSDGQRDGRRPCALSGRRATGGFLLLR